MMSLNHFSKSVTAVGVSLAMLVGVTGCGSGSASGSNSANPVISGVTGPTVTFLNGDFLMSMTLASVSVNEGLTVPIPHMPNSSLQVGPDLQSNGTLISVTLSATDLATLTKGAVTFLSPQTLPGGRPLPGISDGQIPAIAVSVPKWDNMVFYVGPSVFGVFVPVKLGFQNYIGTFRFFDSKGDDVGNLSIVGEDANNANSGVLLLIPIAGKVASLISQ